MKALRPEWAKRLGDDHTVKLDALATPTAKAEIAAALAERGWAEDDTAEFLHDLEVQYKAPFPEINEDTLAGGLANTIAAVAPMRAADTQGMLAAQLANQLGDIDARISSVRQQRGPLTAKALTDLRGSEFEKYAVMEGLGLDARKAALDAATDAARIRESARGRRAGARQRAADRRSRERVAGAQIQSRERISSADRASRETIASMRARGVSQSEINRIRKVRQESKEALGRLQDAQSLWNELKGRRIRDPQTNEERLPSPSELKAALREEGFSPSEIHLMLLNRVGKKWGSREIEMAHALGIRIPRRFLPDREKVKRPRHAKGPSGQYRPT